MSIRKIFKMGIHEGKLEISNANNIQELLNNYYSDDVGNLSIIKIFEYSD